MASSGKIKKNLQGVAAILLALLVALAGVVLQAPTRAYAQGGVELISYESIAHGEQYPDLNEVNIDPIFVLEFSKNVSYDDGRRDIPFVEENLSLVRVETADGTLVEYGFASTESTREFRNYIKVEFSEPLEPLTQYNIIVEPGIRAANGEDVSQERYELPFKTNAMTKNGLTLFQNGVLVAVPILLVIGLIATLVKRLRQTSKRRL